MKFVVDNQLPPAMARFIAAEFKFSAMHVVDAGLRDASDAEIWTYVSKSDSILISKDEDFANMVLQAPTATAQRMWNSGARAKRWGVTIPALAAPG